MNVKPLNDQGAAAPQPAWVRHALPIIAVGTIMIGFSPILVRLSEVGPVATGVNRMLLPLPVFLIWMALKPAQRLPLAAPNTLQTIGIIVLSGVFFAGDLIAWHWSIALTSVANATVLANLSPVIVVIAAWLMFGEQVGGRFIAGLVLALAGMATLMGESLAISLRTLAGDALSIVAAFFYASYLLTVSRARKRAPTVAIMFGGGAVSSILLYALAWFWEGDVWPETAAGWAAALGLAFTTQIMGQTLIAIGLAHVRAGAGAMMLMMQPVCAAVLAWALFGENLSIWQAAGGAAILSGLYVSQRAKSAKPLATA